MKWLKRVIRDAPLRAALLALLAGVAVGVGAPPHVVAPVAEAVDGVLGAV